jgi:hypothetical protein
MSQRLLRNFQRNQPNEKDSLRLLALIVRLKQRMKLQEAFSTMKVF